MSETITQQLRQAFHLASLRNEAKRARTPENWRELGQVRDRYAKLYEQEDRTFRKEYSTRVEMARKRLIDKAASKPKDFKHRWFSNDQFDKAAILRQAQREVRAHHRIQMDGLEKQETRELEAVLARAGRMSDLRDKANASFERAANRRGGSERRVPRSRQRER